MIEFQKTSEIVQKLGKYLNEIPDLTGRVIVL